MKQLLRESDLSLRTVARLAGFKHPEYMSVAFKRVTGESPSLYRGERLG